MLPNQFPPSQCSSYFTQWLISEYLNRVNESKPEDTNQQQLVPPAVPLPPPKTPPPTPPSSHNHHTFTAKHLKHLFTHATSKHHVGSHSNNKPNNNEYKNGLSSSSTHQGGSTSPESTASPKNIEFIQLLALNALEFTAPIYSFLNKKQGSEKPVHQAQVTTTTHVEQTRKLDKPRCPSTRTFVQLSGHPGSFAPAGPNTVWKKMPEDCGSTVCGRDQRAGKSLRMLLESLHINGEQQMDSSAEAASSSTTTTHHHHHYNNHYRPPSSSSKPKSPPPPHTTPITVFFNESAQSSPDDPSNSSTSSSSSSSSSTAGAAAPLLQPQIYSIPTHLLPNETQVYRAVNSKSPPDSMTRIIPKYVTETCYCSQMFLELEDLLTNFSKPNPTIMDIKLGTRTFLESEVKNSKPRPDLYQKLITVDPSACTDEEHDQKAVTKLTYMLFREKQSSSNSLGFRVEGVKVGENGEYNAENQLDDVNFKVLKNEHEILNVFVRFCKRNLSLARRFLERLCFIRTTLEESDFFMTHEVIGSSLLLIHDDIKTGIWLIDFAKTFPVPGSGRVTHRDVWKLGNSEDGVLTGVDSTIRLFTRVVEELAAAADNTTL